MQTVMGKTTWHVQQVAPLDPYEDCVEKTRKCDRNHADKGWPFELIWTRENNGGDIGADFK